MLVCCSRSCPFTSASQKLSKIVQQFQTHHFQQFLVIPELCRAEQFRRCFPQYARTYMPGCQRCHLRPNAPVQGLAWYVACCCVLSDGTWTLMSCRPITSGSFSSPCQGYLVELASDGKTLPNTAMTGSSTFRITCGDDAFNQDSLDFPHLSSTGALFCARTKVPRVSYTGDNFAGMSSVLDKWLSGRLRLSSSH